MISMSSSAKDNALSFLQTIARVDLDQKVPENKALLRRVIEKLVIIVGNAIEHPMIQKYRKLPKTAKMVMMYITSYPNVV